MLFGKLPEHGDFVSRGLAAADRDALDAWLSHQLSAAEETMVDFEDRFYRAPPWQFHAPGLGGAMTPSCDRVGRLFPIWIALADIPGAEDDAAELCETLLYDALNEKWTADHLFAALKLFVPEPGDPVTDAVWWTFGSDWYDDDEIKGDRPPDLIDRMLAMRSEARV